MKRILTSLVLFIACAIGYVAQADVLLTKSDGTTQSFKTFETAIGNINAQTNLVDCTIKLMSNEEVVNETISFDKKIKLVIDLNGRDLDFIYKSTHATSFYFFTIDSGDVKITDTSVNADGCICFNNSGTILRGITVSAPGSLEILKGTLVTKSLDFVLIDNFGYLKIEGGIFECKRDSVDIDCLLTNTGTATIRGGAFEGVKIVNDGFIGFFGGSFSANETAGCFLSNGGGALISGGNFLSKAEIGTNSLFEICGGHFNAELSLPVTNTYDNSSRRITGGEFPYLGTNDPDESWSHWIASGHQWDGSAKSVIRNIETSMPEPIFPLFQRYSSATSSSYRVEQSVSVTGAEYKVEMSEALLLGNSTNSFVFKKNEQLNAANLIMFDFNGFDVNGKMKFDFSDMPVKMYGPGSVSDIVFSGSRPPITKMTSAQILLPEQYAWGADGMLTDAVCNVVKNDRAVGFFTIDEAIKYAPGKVVRLLRNTDEVQFVSRNVTIDMNGFSLKVRTDAEVMLTLRGNGILKNAAIGEDSVICKTSASVIGFGEEMQSCEWDSDNVLKMIAILDLTINGVSAKCVSIAGAIDCVPTNGIIGRIKLVKNVSVGEITVTSQKRICLDANGFLIAGTNSAQSVSVENNGLLILQDTAVSDQQQVQIFEIVNWGTLGVEGGWYAAPDDCNLITAGRVAVGGAVQTATTSVWIEGGVLISLLKVLDVGGSGGTEIRGGILLGEMKWEYGGKPRILGGVFSQDPSDCLIGARTAVYDAKSELFEVGDVQLQSLPSQTVATKMASLAPGQSEVFDNVGVLMRTADKTVLKLDNPFVKVDGAAVSVRKADAAVTASARSDDDKVEANKQMILLNAAYDVTTGANGKPALDYVYDFKIDAFTVVPLPCDDPAKERNELRFTLGLREGVSREARTVKLKNARVTVMCNDEPLPVTLEKPVFTDGVCEFVTTIETDRKVGRAILFRIKLDSLTTK